MANKKNKIRNIPSKGGIHFSPPAIEPPKDYNSNKPAFSFRYMNYGGKKCLSKCDKESKSSISDTLLRLSQLTWKEIISKPKTGLGFEEISYEQFKNSLPKSVTPDVSMFVFRFSSSGRMAGFRDRDIYHIVQVSPVHDLY